MSLHRVPLLLALIAFLALSILVLVRWGKARVVAEVQGELLAPPVGEGKVLVWLERGAEGDRLMLRQGRSEPRALFTGERLSGLALQQGAALTTREEGGERRFLAISLSSGGERDLFAVSGLAKEIVVGKEWVCWLSETAAALPAAPYVVAGRPVTALWATSQQQDRPLLVRLLTSGGADLLGESGGEVYWVEQDGHSSRICRQEIGGGPAQALASEPGEQRAVLLGDRIAWTANSQEAAKAGQYCCVKTRPYSGGEPTVIADWVLPEAALLCAGDAVYAQERDRLWSLGGRRGEQRVSYRASYRGESPTVVEGVEYLAAQERGKIRLMRRGLTWSGKLRVMIGR